jgi:hypothetical protein
MMSGPFAYERYDLPWRGDEPTQIEARGKLKRPSDRRYYADVRTWCDVRCALRLVPSTTTPRRCGIWISPGGA